jgi:hypothetical protein
MATWGIWLFVIGRRTLTSDLGENGVKTLVCVCMCVCVRACVRACSPTGYSCYIFTSSPLGTTIPDFLCNHSKLETEPNVIQHHLQPLVLNLSLTDMIQVGIDARLCKQTIKFERRAVD